VTALWIAIATVREAARGRASRSAVLLAGALFLLVALLPAVTAEDRAVMLVRLLVGLSGVVAVVTAAFIGSAAISGDLEHGRLAVLLCKPVSRASYVVGKALGVAALGPLLLAGLFLVSAALFHGSAGRSLSADVPLLHPDREIAGEARRDGPALEWRFGRESLAARASKLRLRIRAEDPRVPRVPLLVELSSGDGGPHECRLLLAGAGIARDMEVPPDLVPKEELRVRVTPREGDAALRADPDALVLIGPSRRGFTSNLALAFASLAGAASLAGVVAVCASAVLNGRLALHLALALVAAGFSSGSIRAFGRFVSLGAPLSLFGETPPEAGEPGPLRAALGCALEAVGRAVPDLARFDLSSLLVAGHEVSWSALGRNAGYALAYAAAGAVLACWLFRGRELSR
jgi:hypothetical protein